MKSLSISNLLKMLRLQQIIFLLLLMTIKYLDMERWPLSKHLSSDDMILSVSWWVNNVVISMPQISGTSEFNLLLSILLHDLTMLRNSYPTSITRSGIWKFYKLMSTTTSNTSIRCTSLPRSLFNTLTISGKPRKLKERSMRFIRSLMTWSKLSKQESHC